MKTAVPEQDWQAIAYKCRSNVCAIYFLLKEIFVYIFSMIASALIQKDGVSVTGHIKNFIILQQRQFKNRQKNWRAFLQRRHTNGH